MPGIVGDNACVVSTVVNWGALDIFWVLNLGSLGTTPALSLPGVMAHFIAVFLKKIISRKAAKGDVAYAQTSNIPPNTALRHDGYDTFTSCVLVMKGGEEHIEWLFCSMRKTKKYIFVHLLTLKRRINEP